MDFFFDGTSVKSMGLIPSVDGNMDPAEPNITWDEPAYATPIDTSEFVSGHPTYSMQDANYIELIVADPNKKEELWRWLFSYHGHEVEMASTLREYNGEMARWHSRVSVSDVSPVYEKHDVFRVSWERGPWLYYSDGTAGIEIKEPEWSLGPFGEGTHALVEGSFPDGYSASDCGWNYQLLDNSERARTYMVILGTVIRLSGLYYIRICRYGIHGKGYGEIQQLRVVAGIPAYGNTLQVAFYDGDGEELEYDTLEERDDGFIYSGTGTPTADSTVEREAAKYPGEVILAVAYPYSKTLDETYPVDIPAQYTLYGSEYYDYSNLYTYSDGVLTPIIGSASVYTVDDQDADSHTIDVGDKHATAQVQIVNPDGLSYGYFDMAVTSAWQRIYGEDTTGWDGSLYLDIRNNGSVMQLRYQTDNWYPFTFTVSSHDIPDYEDFKIYQYSETLVQVPDCAADALFAEDTFYMTYPDISAVTVVDNRTPMDSSLAVSTAYKVTLRDLTGTYPDSVSVEGTEIVEWDSRLLSEVEVSVPYQPEVFSAIEEEDFPAADMYSDVYRLHENAMDETAPWSGDYVTSEYDGLVWGADMHTLAIGERWPDWEPGMLLEYSDDMDEMNGYAGIYADGFYEKLHTVEVSMTWERADV